MILKIPSITNHLVDCVPFSQQPNGVLSLGKLLNLSVTQFLYVENETNNSAFSWLL